jgi:spermidine synthase
MFAKGSSRSDGIAGSPSLVIGVVLVSLATLLYELTQIRVFAYCLHPVVAFSAIALAMLGFGLGATLLALKPSWSEGDLRRRLGGLCAALGLSIVAVNLAFASSSTGIIEPGSLEVDYLFTALAMLPSILPYFLAGLVTALILGDQVAKIGRIYFWNLLGSAAGCVLMIVLLRPLGAERLLLVAAALAGIGGLVLAWRSSRIVRLTCLGVGAAALISIPFAETVFPLMPDVTGYNAMFERLELKQGYQPPVRELSEWDPVGRLEVLNHERTTVRVPEEVGYRVLTVDGGAMTLLLEGQDRPGWGEGLFRDSIYGAAYYVKQEPRVLVIGAGGGTDIEAALHWGSPKVTGVEISLSALRAVTESYREFAGWPDREEVELVHADGRAFAKSTDERFDVIQMSGVDTVTSHASGSMITVEDYLYTVEAFRDLLEILAPDGVLSVVRFGDEAMNLSRIAVAALRRLDVDQPHRCVVALRQARLAGVLVKREPFTASQIVALKRLESRDEIGRVEIPIYDVGGINLGDPVRLLHPGGRLPAPRYRKFFEGVRLGEEERAARQIGNAFVVPTDDRPYYMLHQWIRSAWAREDAHPTVRLLLASTVVIALASLILIVVPVFSIRRGRRATGGALASVSVYFFCIGAGFMLLEVGLIHRAMVFVGTPGASVAVVLASILVSSGLGSRVSDRVGWSPTRRILGALLGLLLVGAGYHLGAGRLFDALFGWPTWARCAAAAAAIAPAGFCMGWFFPVGLRVAAGRFDRLVPWAIAINGFASVIGSLLTFFLGLAIGFGGVFTVALALYVLATASMLPFARRGAGSTEAVR